VSSGPAEVDEVILGQVLTAGEGQNPARQAAMAAGVPQEATAWGLNQLCGSGLRAVALGMQQIANGDAKIIVAGGQESMSMAPHAAHLRGGTKMGDFKMIDTMIKDGLTGRLQRLSHGQHRRERRAQWQITREEQDQFAVPRRTRPRPRRRPASFKDEIVPVTIKGRKGDIIVDQTNTSAHGATIEAMAKLRPPSTRTAPSPPATPRASMTAPPPPC
jgi:acetyl-CoA C-acetyltransferase